MMTKAFALNGAAKVYIVGRRKEKLDEAAKISPNIVPIVGDVTSKQSLQDAANFIKKDTGYLNLAICNSGTMPQGVSAKPDQATLQEYAKAAMEVSFENWAESFATNTVSVAFTTFAFLELLDAGNKKGNAAGRTSQVLVTSSIAGYMRQSGSNLAYGSAKAAVTHMVKHLSGTLSGYDIRVNAIAPGLFPSDLASGLVKVATEGADDPTADGAVPKTKIPAARLGRDDDMTGIMLYLASRAGAYMNGCIEIIDGGRLGLLASTY